MSSNTIDVVEDLIQKGELDAADKQLADDASTHESDSQWWLMRGIVLTRRGEYEEAMEALDHAIKLDADNSEAIFQMAYISDLYGDDDSAIELYKKCVADSPMHTNALINLAVLYEDREQFEEAKRTLMKLLAEYPNHKRAALFLKDIDSSLDMFYDEDQERSLEKQNAILDIPISDFELSVRSRNCLKKMNIHTLGDLLRTTEPELLSYKNFGETSLNEIKTMLHQRGLRLGQIMDSDEVPVMRRPRPELPDADAILLNKAVHELELSVRARKCLQRLNIMTLADLVSCTESELLSSKNFGQTSLQEIQLRLSECGLSLRED